MVVVATAALSVLAATRVSWHEVWAGLRASDLRWMLPSLALFAVAIAMRGLRWQTLFAGDRPPLAAVSRALLLGYFFNTVLPARAGEPVRIVVLRQESHRSGARITATVILERLLDVIVLLVLVGILLPWLPRLEWDRSAWLLGGLVLVLLAFLAALAFRGERTLRRLLRPASWLPRMSETHVASLAGNLSHGLSGLRSARVITEAATWTVLSWIVLGLSAWTLLFSFGLHFSPLAGFLVVAATSLTSVLPTLPAGIGVFEAAAVLALDAYGVGHSKALSYAVIWHAINVVPFLIVGAPLVRRHADLWRVGRRATVDEQEAAG
ncbi:MAG: lysylphosphatidylglycerol synthase transmembrane domain-containing protein [Gaiellaceae bacterium]